jgi:hypothetical protein
MEDVIVGDLCRADAAPHRRSGLGAKQGDAALAGHAAAAAASPVSEAPQPEREAPEERNRRLNSGAAAAAAAGAVKYHGAVPFSYDEGQPAKPAAKASEPWVSGAPAVPKMNPLPPPPGPAQLCWAHAFINLNSSNRRSENSGGCMG